MSLSLSELFAQHQSQNSSTKEESNQDDDDENRGIKDGDRTLNQSLLGGSEQNSDKRRNFANVTEQKKPKKRARSPRKKNTERDENESKPTAKAKRIKSESFDDNCEKDEVYDETNGHILEDTENYGDDEFGDEEDGNFNRLGNQRFYQNYSESLKALFNSQTQSSGKQKRNSKKTLEIVNATLNPKKNERRLPGEEVPSRSLAGRYKPRKKRIKGSSRSSKTTEASYRLETQEEIRDRVQRMEGYAQRDALRVRWKSRTVDFRSEQDIGGAFWLRAKESIGEKLRSDEKERRSRAKREKKEELKRQRKEERERMKELERSDFLEEDDEVKEQSQLLAQLSQPEITLKEEENSDYPTDNAASNESLQKKSNYWELGYTTPNISSISFDYDPSVEKMVQSASNEAIMTGSRHSKENCANDETRASFSALMRKQEGGRNSSRFFFEPNRALISNGKSTFRPGYRSGHVHQLLNMAARSLCGNGGSRCTDDTIELENQYIRLLCKQHEDESKKKRHFDSTICADFRKRGFITTLAEEQGKNMLLYLQNAWDDPTKVATELGIIDCSQESPMRGNLLATIKEHTKNKRLQIKKSHKIRSIDWNHGKNDDDSDSDQEETNEDATMPLDSKLIGEITTHGGVVDAVTLETSMTIDRRRNYGPSSDDRDALITPTTFYSHIAGTKPPIPPHPISPCGWIFGPVDRHSRFYHTSVKMDSSIYKIVLSTLMKRIGRARRSTKSESFLRRTQEQIMNLVEEFANINENKFYLQYTNMIQDPFDSDIPLVEFYRGVNQYCTYMANGFLEMHQQEPKKDPDVDDEINREHEHDDAKIGSGMNLIAGKIWEFCQPKIRQNALLRFPRLRSIFGIALICRSINPSAAEILSRPIDIDSICTPLDLFRDALEDMEAKKYIATTRTFEDSSIRAVELEFLLHDAAEFFQEAVELDPTNVEYQLWHIGCLASCLLVSSGNKICASSAHVHPSQMKGTFMDAATVSHEVRPRMKKYNEVRVELSTAVRTFLTLVKYQDSPRAHLGVFSLLEWKQVVGLLVGSQLGMHLKDIQRRHAFHFKMWAHREPITFLKEYKGTKENICVASLYAQILENDPGEITNWRNFILSLGPLSDKSSEDWWGKDRSWWADSLLHMTSPNIGDPIIDGDILEDLLTKLKEATVSSSVPLHNALMETKIFKEDKDTNEDDQAIEWLPTLENLALQTDEQEVRISEEERTRCYASHLPRMEKNVSKNRDEPLSSLLPSTAIPPSKISLPRDLASHTQEVQAYKIYISCHLFGVDHQSVRKSIYYNLLHNFDRNELTSDKFRVMVWLSSMNIDIEEVVRSMEFRRCE